MFSGAILREGDFYEADILDYIRDTYPVQKTIVDAGANIGNHSVYFANFLQYERIVCFEPFYPNFRLLVENMEAYSNITLMQAALGDHNGIVAFAPNFSNMGAGEVRDYNAANPDQVTVCQTTIDAFKLRDITLIKMDVEYSEPLALMGAYWSMHWDSLKHTAPLLLIEDSQNRYEGMLKDEFNYKLIKSWDHHKTYLYEHNNAELYRGLI